KEELRWAIARKSVAALGAALRLEPEANLGANWAAIERLLAPMNAGDLSNPSSAVLSPLGSVWAQFLMLAIHWPRSNSYLIRTFFPLALPLSAFAPPCR